MFPVWGKEGHVYCLGQRKGMFPVYGKGRACFMFGVKEGHASCNIFVATNSLL